jgi:regulator of protease activity HflC (stomatin/prohibitin superfamily)
MATLSKESPRGGIKLIVGAFAAVVFLIVIALLWPFATVDAGYVGVMTSFGAPSADVYEPGLHFRMPIRQSMHQVYVGIQKQVADVGGASHDLQQVDMKVAVNFDISPSAAVRMYSQYNSDPWSTVMDPAVHDVVKAVAARYDATDLIQKRDEVSQAIRSDLMTRFTGVGVNVTAVNVMDLGFSKQFDEAIEAKITAQQNAQRVENEIAQTRYEAQKRVVESEAALQVAQNQAKANDILGQSLAANPSLIEKMKIEKWDGHYPSTMMGNGVPMIQLGSK